MNRVNQLQELKQTQQWDVVIIGGGATGLGTALDSASRGYKTLLLEKYDFAKGTSSKATKLVHGGVRYLAQGNFRLVRDALKERGLLLKNAAHVCNTISFVIPCYSWWAKLLYGTGLIFYDVLSGKMGLGKTKLISASKTLQLLPQLNPKGLKGGVIYTDGQFDDSRLAINLAQTAIENGATVLNYISVDSLLKENGKISGLTCTEQFTKQTYTVKAKSIINATGVFVDDIMQMDSPQTENCIKPSQGVHIVIDKKHFSSTSALMIPKTTDGRVLFAVPWHNAVVVGTTDTPVNTIEIEPRPLNEEIQFILKNVNQYFQLSVTVSDVQSVFAGLRPLVKRKQVQQTSSLARDHVIFISKSGLITITGGKWTTYRKMAEQVIDKAILVAGLAKTKSGTSSLPIHGNTQETILPETLAVYGTDAAIIKEMMKEDPITSQLLHPDFEYRAAQVIWAVEKEMAITIEDVLARRLRLLFINAKAAIEAAPKVAEIMARELNKDAVWVEQQISAFSTLAKQYILS